MKKLIIITYAIILAIAVDLFILSYYNYKTSSKPVRKEVCVEVSINGTVQWKRIPILDSVHVIIDNGKIIDITAPVEVL